MKNWLRPGLWLWAGLLAGCVKRPVHEVMHRNNHYTARSNASGFSDDIYKSQSSRYRIRNDSVPEKFLLDINKIPEPAPKIEPRSLYGNKSPYTVLGRTYYVLPTARGYDERGIASFYGSKFQGYKTSNLETYDMYKFTAAHKTLPLPSYARVTNLDNGKSVIVRINDRGPFYSNRLIDLSFAAAVKIGIWPKGTGRVEVRGLVPEQPQKLSTKESVTAHSFPLPALSEPVKELSKVSVVAASKATSSIYLQVGAFAEAANAKHIAMQLREAGITPVQIIQKQVSNRMIRRVWVGPLSTEAQIEHVSAMVEALGLPKPQLAEK